MTIRRALLIALVVVLFARVVAWFVETQSPIGYLVMAVDLMVFVAFGFMIAIAGGSYRVALNLTLLLLLLPFILSLGSVALDLGETPPDWNDEKQRLSFYGFLVASALFVPVALALSALGILIQRVFKHVSKSAA